VSHLSAHSPCTGRLARGAAAVAVSVAFLTACGDDSTDTGAAGTSSGASTEPTGPTTETAAGSGSSSGESPSVTATESDFSISLAGDTLPAGTYQITVVNQGDATHDLVVERDGEDVGESEDIGPGESTTFTVMLESGDYVFYCSIGNHRSMGMETDVSVS
jgi:uncharacterized cupredoxin-like copper-binding protein